MRTPDHQRRLHPRIDLSLEVLYAFSEEALEQGGKHAELFDLSPTGLRIEIEDEVEISSLLQIGLLARMTKSLIPRRRSCGRGLDRFRLAAKFLMLVFGLRKTCWHNTAAP